jgi:hypothetical protein
MTRDMLDTQLEGILDGQRAYPTAGFALTKGGLGMTERIAQLEAALSAQSALFEEAQAEIARYLSKEMEAPEFVNRLIQLLDGPQQREAQTCDRDVGGCWQEHYSLSRVSD